MARAMTRAIRPSGSAPGNLTVAGNNRMWPVLAVAVQPGFDVVASHAGLR